MKHQLLSYDLLPEMSAALPEQTDQRYRAMRRALKQAMREELTPRQRECMELWMAGEKEKDIAKELGLVPSTVTEHLQRGTVRLRRALRYGPCFWVGGE